MFHYCGNTRLQYIFHSPNTFGTFLGMAIILGMYLAIKLLDQNNKLLKLNSIPIFGGLIYLQFLLAMTYSRGAYLAMLCSMMFLCWIYRNKYCVLMAGTFGGALIWTSAGIQRISSISDFGQGSIYHRLLLWHGGTGLIINNFLHGMDFREVGQSYTAWYQPLWLNEHYSGLISDYLNIAISKGIFFLSGYLILIFILTWFLFKIARLNQSLWCAVLASTIIFYLIASAFSTHFLFIKVYSVFLATLAISFITIVWNMIKKRYKVSWKDFFIPVMMSVLISSAISMYGLFVNTQKDFTYHDIVQNRVRVVKAIPRTHPKALIIYVFDSQRESYTTAIRKVVRPLLKRNFEVRAIGIDSGFDGQKKLYNFIKKATKERKIFLFGNADGAKQTIIAASKIKQSKNLLGIIALNSPSEWPFPELSPIRYVDNVTCPALFISSSKPSYDDSIKLLNKINSKDKQHYNIKHQTNCPDMILALALKKLSSFIEKVDNASNSQKAVCFESNL